MKTPPAPFAAFEWNIAWHYLRARKREGGISVIAWYALIGVMLGVATLIVVQAVMIGFREEFTERILGANSHASVYYSAEFDEFGNTDRLIADYNELALRLAEVPGVERAAPLIRGQVMASAGGRAAGVEIIGTQLEDLRQVPLISQPEMQAGTLDRFGEGVAIGSGVARELGVGPGDMITLISPEGMDTPFGTQPRLNDYEVVYIFGVGRYDIDRTRVYVPFSEAQRFFDREGGSDEIEVMLVNPADVDAIRAPLAQAAGARGLVWTWKDANSAFLSALDVERRVMFIVLSLVVLIAALNIISGLVMLVKNKSRDIGILRTMGFAQGSILRIFFICGASIGLIGTALGVVLGCLFAYNIQEMQALVEWVSGGSVWNPEVRFLTEIPARLRPIDVFAVVAMAIGLSFVITIWPARSAARLDPVEALRDG
ncbi:lipoprotein-releasing ABC transporter permease subunit [Amaricoccus macauensis]|uniref:lipoprotein-releasing ABC transporter permease subunit n=1 Tax=Amaricoccus macauensis TaxID=57001 RepID=UPI003C7C9140